MDLNALIAELLKLPTADVIAGIKDKARAIYQPIFNEGHGVATAALKPQAESTEAMLAEEKRKREAAEAQLAQWKKDNPAAGQIHDDYAKQLRAKDEEIAQLKNTHKEDRRLSIVDRIVGKVRAKLMADVDEDKVESMLDRRDNRNRITVDDNMVARIVQAGQTIPFGGDEDAQVAAFAEELKKGIDVKFLKSSVASGSAREGAAGSGAGGGAKGKIFDEIRNSVKQENKKSDEPSPADKLDSRFGVRR